MGSVKQAALPVLVWEEQKAKDGRVPLLPDGGTGTSVSHPGTESHTSASLLLRPSD